MSSIIKGIQGEQAVEKRQPEVQVPGYGTMPLDMLQRHVQSLSKEFNDSIQQGEFLKAAYRTEQFYNALMALAKAMKQQGVSETISTGMGGGSAGIGGGAGLGIEKSPIEKVIEKPLGEGNLPPKAGFNKNPHKVGPGTSKDDYEYKKFIPRDRKEKGEEWAIARDVKNVNSRLGTKKPKELDTGFYKNYLSNRPVREEQELSVQELATISDEALDKAYGYGRSSPGNTFGWQANLMSAAYAKKIIDAGITDIEKISDAIHKGWNVTAQKFVQDPDQFSDTEKLRQAGKLDAKLQQRAKLMKINYAELPDDEQEKDRVVARALLKAIKGEIDESLPTSPGGMGQSYRKFTPKQAGLDEEQAPMFTPEESELSELKKDTISNYLDKQSALVRGGKKEPYKINPLTGKQQPPSWKVAAAKIAKQGSDIERYAKVKATTEEKMVNANDPRSDGWRVYSTKESSIMKGLQTESTLSEVNPVNVWATMSGRGQGGIPADLRVSEIPIDQIGSRGLFWGSYRDTVFYNIMSGNAFREYEQEYKKKGKEPDVEKIKQQVIKLAKAAGLEQDADGKWYFDVYTPMTKERKSHMTYLEYNFGRPYDKKDTKSKKESSVVKGLQTEAGGITRWSKDNPPPPELLLNTLIQILMNPENKKSPQDLISLWNDKYGLKHTLGGLRQYAQNDYKKAELSKALTKAALAYESSKGK